MAKRVIVTMNKAIIKSLKASVVFMLLFSLIACTTVGNIQEQSSVNVSVAMLHIAPKLAETREGIWQSLHRSQCRFPTE